MSGEFPFRSVGPEPAMMTTSGTGPEAAGTTNVPAIFPVGVSSVIVSLIVADMWISALRACAGFTVDRSAIK
jgi:hypothetical protein